MLLYCNLQNTPFSSLIGMLQHLTVVVGVSDPPIVLERLPDNQMILQNFKTVTKLLDHF